MSIFIQSTIKPHYSPYEMITLTVVRPSLGTSESESKLSRCARVRLGCKKAITQLINGLFAAFIFSFKSITGYPYYFPFQPLLDRVCIKLISLRAKQVHQDLEEWAFADKPNEQRHFAKNRILKNLFMATFFNKLLKAQVLDLSSLGLTSLPSCLDQFSHLKQLNFKGNRFIEMPSQIANLSQLEELNLAFNRLSQFEIEPPQCLALKVLNLAGNYLGNFPATLEKLPNLEFVDCSLNSIMNLPSDFQPRFKVKW